MTATSATPTAQERPKKTRSKTLSSREALAASTVRPEMVNLRGGEFSLVCPDCATWCPITGHQGSNPKLVPHHTSRAGTAGQRRCAGSNRRVLIDVDVTDWGRRVAEADATVAGRRGTRVLRKPKSAPARAVAQIAAAPESRLTQLLAKAGLALAEHRPVCSICRTGRARCEQGRELEVRHAEIQATVRITDEQQRQAQRRSALGRAEQWRKVAPAVNRTDSQRRELPEGSTVVGPIKSAALPRKAA